MFEFERWSNQVTDPELQEELRSLVGNEKEIEDRFYRSLAFGTGGLRGLIGVGTNRMNRYTVGRATMGLADYMQKNAQSKIVIAYDSRKKSAEFARLAAEIMSCMGIQAYLFPELTPTPVLSFAVRHLGADAGIVITASHNPKEYNGYKVYNAHGCQITDEAATAITESIERYDYFTPFEANEDLITLLDDGVKEAFLNTVLQLSKTKITPKNAPSVVYSPLCGTGRVWVQEILARLGVKKLVTVAEQEMPDENFTTCPFPNPEEKDALTLALRDAEQYRPDIVMATDPDADRIGIAVPDQNGNYVLLNGNETGSILLYYLLFKSLEAKEALKGSTVIKTIVTTDIVFDMAKEFDVAVKEVLTGFKYIGEELDKTERYLFGLEESYGYLVGTHVRDKDAVSAAMLIVEACAYFKERGKGLYAVLQEIYQRYGYYRTDLQSITLRGKDGAEKMQTLLKELRETPFEVLGAESLRFDDFEKGLHGLPKSPVLRFQSEHYRLIIRPSGTEPKMKLYLQAKGASMADAEHKLDEIRSFIKEHIAK